MLLEKLLERETISHNTLRQLDKCYSLSNGNAEVWCNYFPYFVVAFLMWKSFYTGKTELNHCLVKYCSVGDRWFNFTDSTSLVRTRSEAQVSMTLSLRASVSLHRKRDIK